MSESLLGRVARLVGGTFNTVVDAAESAAPEVVARQASTVAALEKVAAKAADQTCRTSWSMQC